MTPKISPSLMCIDLLNAQQSIHQLEQAGADMLHIDIMDNHFVPNITLSPDFVARVKQITTLPLDVHLMIEQPEQSLPLFNMLDHNDILTVHLEASTHIQRTLSLIGQMGIQAGIALNPATPVEMLEYLLNDIQMVLVMTVNPGFAGQALVPSTLAKIQKLRSYLNHNGKTEIPIQVDGNVSFENAKKMQAMGASIYVGGTSSLFSPQHSLFENFSTLRKIIQP